MKSIFRRSLGAWTALVWGCMALVSGAVDEPDHPVHPMLWKVEGGKLEKPSWLFGTIHLGKGPVGTLNPTAAEALDGADVVYAELDMDPSVQVGLAQHFIRQDGKTLTDSLGDELSDQLDAELAAIQPALNSVVLQSFKTWAVAITLPLLELQLEGQAPLDMILWNRAEEAGKLTRALEKPEDQFRIFDDLSEQEQVDMLAETLKQMKESRDKGENPNDGLIAAYVAGDDEKLQQWMNRYYDEMLEGEHAELGKKLMKRLLDDRNEAMAGKMAEFLAAEPNRSHFFAVGTAHYLGNHHVRGFLTEKGYKITRVTE
ncbi:hypothetical protein HNR46_001882 [Haloferula luteola]|uniref:TraB/GumN family protein n=1 Tax=Haloferula luteola TaxID=595692 RepID=A0A840V2F4_9BACT|nr:TraB/GumN family protein [Haloferula luteola]MBB5351643.1 hypothetical protein [Haloferula luteola]